MRVSGFGIACLLALAGCGCATGRGPRQIADVTPGGAYLASNWSRVSEVEAGAEIMVATRSSPALKRYFVSADDTGMIVLNDRRVRETIAREDVAEIRGPVAAPGSVGGAILGAYVGFAVGALPGLGGAPRAVAWTLWFGSMALGGFLGSHWSNHQTDGLIYWAPGISGF